MIPLPPSISIKEAFRRVWLSEISVGAESILSTAYQARCRHFHRMRHIEQVLGLLQWSGGLNQETAIAAAFHDAVYIPGSAANEALSARLAARVLIARRVPLTTIVSACDAIEATKAHDSADPAVQHLLDADMTILGAPPHVYAAYCQQIRAEHREVPTGIFYAGRLKFLQATLSRPTIFLTDVFRGRFETAARDNVSAELQRLQSIDSSFSPTDIAFREGYQATSYAACHTVEPELMDAWREGFVLGAASRGQVPEDCPPATAGRIACLLGLHPQDGMVQFDAGIAWLIGWHSQWEWLDAETHCSLKLAIEHEAVAS